MSATATETHLTEWYEDEHGGFLKVDGQLFGHYVVGEGGVDWDGFLKDRQGVESTVELAKAKIENALSDVLARFG